MIMDLLSKVPGLSNVYCCVFGCKSKYGSKGVRSFHHFPRPGRSTVRMISESGGIELIDRRLAWIRALKAASHTVTKHSRVCSLHFSPKHFMSSIFTKRNSTLKRNVLVPTAVPDQNLPIIPYVESGVKPYLQKCTQRAATKILKRCKQPSRQQSSNRMKIAGEQDEPIETDHTYFTNKGTASSFCVGDYKEESALKGVNKAERAFSVNLPTNCSVKKTINFHTKSETTFPRQLNLDTENIEVSFRFLVQATVKYDKAERKIVHKQIKVVTPEHLIKTENNIAVLSDKSIVSNPSAGSAGSVYSDKTGLPYKLLNLGKANQSSTESCSKNMEDIVPWQNVSLFALACDSQLPRIIEYKYGHRSSSSTEHLEPAQAEVLPTIEKLVTDHADDACGNFNIVKIPPEEAATEPGEDNSSPELIVQTKSNLKRKKRRIVVSSKKRYLESVKGLARPVKVSRNVDIDMLGKPDNIDLDNLRKNSSFQGFNFLLCCADVQDDTLHQSSDSYASDSEDYDLYSTLDAKCPFETSRAKKIIEAGGGRVFANFDEIPLSEYTTTFLVTNRPNFTARYLLAFVHNFRMVLYAKLMKVALGEEQLWRIDLDHVAWSPIYKKWLPWPKKKPFDSVTFRIDMDDYDNFWHTILNKSGAIVGNSNNPKYILVSDNYCPTKSNVVTAAWIVQCLFHGTLLPTNISFSI